MGTTNAQIRLHSPISACVIHFLESIFTRLAASIISRFQLVTVTGPVGQSVASLTVDPGIISSIPAWSHTFVEIDCELISTAILLYSADSRRVVVNYKRNYVHKVLVNCLVKLAQEKVW